MSRLVTVDVIKDFKAFAEQQDPQRVIDHGGSWAHCAVGEFADTVGRSPYSVAADLYDVNYDVYVVLATKEKALDIAPTYGALVKLLEAA